MTKPTVKSEWGLCCPKCGRDDGLKIEVKTWAVLTPDGTDAILGAQEWDEDSFCYCPSCNKYGYVNEFDCS